DPARLLAAADHFDRLGRRPDAAFALQEAAVRLAMRGELPPARAAFGRAVAIYEGLGAVLDLRRMQARLRPHGIRSGSHAAHRRATTGWEALTETEHQSPNTVLAVAHILTNVHAHTRRDIAREVNYHQTAHPPRSEVPPIAWRPGLKG